MEMNNAASFRVMSRTPSTSGWVASQVAGRTGRLFVDRTLVLCVNVERVRGAVNPGLAAGTLPRVRPQNARSQGVRRRGRMAEAGDGSGRGRARTATFVDLAEGIAALVHDGDTVALEGFTHLIPVAAGQEIIRQRRRDLELVRMTPDIVYD